MLVVKHSGRKENLSGLALVAERQQNQRLRSRRLLQTHAAAMADDESNGGSEPLVPNLSHERPLDSLLPEMNSASSEAVHDNAPSEVGAVHPRVLEVGLDDGREWTMAIWEATDAERLVDELQQLTRATLLRRLSRPSEGPGEPELDFLGLRLFSFDSLRRQTREQLEHRGFSEVSYDPDEFTERMKAWRGEARSSGVDVPARPISIWLLPVEHHDDERREDLEAIEAYMAETLGEERWGQTPGGISKLFARRLEDRYGVEVGLGRSGLDTMEEFAFPEADGAVRWSYPLFFQAVCDYIGVVLHASYGIEVQWGICEPGPRGEIPPPIFRHPASGRTIPVGRALLDWCVLPADSAGGNLADHVDQLAESLQGDG